MVQSHWLSEVNGNFDTAADWSTNAVPGPSDDAILDASGPNYFTVGVTQDAMVNSIQLDATAFLNIQANFTATNGTGTGANDGAIQVQNGDTLTLQGTVNNVGSITLFGTTSTTSLVLGSGGVTLEGGGVVFLNFGGSDQQIVPAAGGSVLTDVNDRISGIGLLGGAGLTIINETGGFIEAKSGALIINTGANTIINAGLIDAEGAPDSGGLPPGLGTVESPVDSSGFLKADGVGSVMTFNDAVTGTGRTVIAGGTLNFKAYFNQDVAFEATSGDLILAQSGNYTSLIQEFSTTGGEFLDLGDIGFVSAGEASYSGTTNGGVLTVSDGIHTANIHFEGNYTGVAFVAGSDGHGGTTITTAGSKALHWLNPVNGSFQTASDWTGGLVPGPGANAVLDAAGSTNYTVTASTTQTVAGIQTASTAILGVTGAFTATAGTDGGATAGRIAIGAGGTFIAGGTLNNTGLISLGASSLAARLVASGGLTLIGGGEIFLSASANDIIAGSSTSATLTNVSNIIAGAGDIGDGELTLINEAAGKIESEEPSTPMVIDTGANIIVNAGLIEAAGAGATIASPVINSGALKADGGNLTVNGAVSGAGGDGVVYNGTLRFNALFNQNVDFEGLSGTLYLAKSANYTSLVAGFSTTTGADSLDLGDIGFVSAGEATFSGTTTGGVLTVTDGTHVARIALEGNYTGVAFVAGSDGSGGTTVTDRPSGSKALHWLNPVNGSFQTAADWTDGLVPGSGNDAVLDAAGSTDYTVIASAAQTVAGIQTAATAILVVSGAFTATNGTDGGVNAGQIAIANGAIFDVGGTLGNSGLITLSASTAKTTFVVAGALTLNGGGDFLTGNNADNIIVGSSGSAVLTNVSDIIAGAGDLGDGELTLVNAVGGEIASNRSSAQLVIDTGANTVVNAGVIEAAGDGLVITGAVANTGYLAADGGNLTVEGAVSGTGVGIIAGGILRFESSFNGEAAFQGASRGVLVLAQSVNYTGLIAGFSASGLDALDLGNIGFVGADEASFSGTTSGGVLTVTDGVHTAHIRFEGNYTGVAFVASGDGNGGTTVTTAEPTAVHWLNPVNNSFQNGPDWTNGFVPGSGNDAVLDAAGSTDYTVTASARQTVAGIQTAATAILGVTGAFTATNGTDGGVTAGRISMSGGGSFTAGGTLDVTGLITLNASGGGASLVAAGALTLTGGGQIFMDANASNIIVGSTAAATLTNASDTIAGAGDLGDGRLTLINEAGGRIESEEPSTLLVMDTGANTIVNAGLIEAEGAGTTIVSPLANSGVLEAVAGAFTVDGAVSGAGRAVIFGGVLRFGAAFSENVAFEGSSGTLYLAQSAGYAGAISGFSTTGANSLDLGDIGFVNGGEASFSGATSGGVLTVTDGTHTAHIRLTGNYTASSFVTSADGHGGTIVVDPTAAAPLTHQFIAAAASFGVGRGAALAETHDTRRAEMQSLARPT